MKAGPKRLAAAAAGALFAALAAGSAAAQTPSTIDQQLQQAAGLAPGAPDRPTIVGIPPLSERILTGREDLVVLRQRKFFTLYAAPSLQWTNNVFLSNANKQPDTSVTFVAGLRAETQIAERFDVFAQFGYVGNRYRRQTGQDFDGWQGRVGVRVPDLFHGLALTMSYDPTAAYARGFGRRLVLQHPLTVSLSRDMQLAEKWFFTAILSGIYVKADPGHYNARMGRGGLYLAYAARPNVVLVGSAEATRRVYERFFPAFFPRDRRDTLFAAGLSMTWQVNEHAQLSASVSYGRGDSSLGRFDHDAWSVSPMLRFSARF